MTENDQRAELKFQKIQPESSQHYFFSTLILHLCYYTQKPLLPNRFCESLLCYGQLHWMPTDIC